jgi:hypothetical protein
MTSISKSTARINELYDKMQIKKLETRHEELQIEERHIKAQLKDNEDKRVEMNRRMNRPGQNIDKMA